MAKPRSKAHETPSNVGVHWTLPLDVRTRFGAFASFRNRTESELVTEALNALMRGFFVGERSFKPADLVPAGPAGPSVGDPAAGPPDLKVAG